MQILIEELQKTAIRISRKLRKKPSVEMTLALGRLTYNIRKMHELKKMIDDSEQLRGLRSVDGTMATLIDD